MTDYPYVVDSPSSQEEYQAFLEELAPYKLIDLYRKLTIEGYTNHNQEKFDTDISMRLFYIELVIRLKMESESK